MTKKSDFENALFKQADSALVPIDVLFELTGRCNFNCKMCYVHTLDAKKALQEELDTDTWLKIMDEAIEAGMMFATLNGGECFLRPDFESLYLHLYERGIRIRINTNGSLLTRKQIEFLTCYRPEAIQISLYGSNEEEYRISTGVPAFSLIEQNMKLLREANIPINIAITPSEQSKDFVTNIIDYAVDHKYPVHLTDMFLSRRDDTVDSDGSTLTLDDICSYAKYYAEKMGRVLVPTSVDALPKPGTGGAEIKQKYHCTAGRNRVHIDWHGVMHPCVSLPDVSCAIHPGTYQEAWDTICKKTAELAFPEKCLSCYYKNVCRPCFVARGFRDNEAFDDNPTCELVLKKVACGLLILKTEEK